VRQQKALAHIDAATPPQEGFQSAPLPPLRIPPDGHCWGCAQMVNLDLPHRAAEKINDGRHVDLDFYDLLIEARYPDRID
jgi:hypothetical protein